MSTMGRRRASLWRGPLLAASLASLLPSSAFALVTQCVGPSAISLCTTSTSPCQISVVKSVAPGAVLDCAGIDLRIISGGTIDVTGGTFTLMARDLTVDAGREVRANPDPVLETGFEIALTGKLVLDGRLSAPNAGGGSMIAVTAGQTIQLRTNVPAIEADGVEESADGGDVFLIADGSITVGRPIRLSGKDAGSEAENVNSGGSLYIDAGGNVDINDEIRSTGRWFGGGDISILSGGNLSINFVTGTGQPKGTIIADGKAMTGYGGYVYLAAAGSVTVNGAVTAAGGIGNSGGQAAGGTVSIVAGCGGVRIDKDVNLSGGLVDGGVLFVDSEGPVVVTSIVDASSRHLGGDGGAIIVTSGRSVELSASAELYADGHDPTISNYDGEGGIILLTGCPVTLNGVDADNGAIISAKGARGGAMSLEGSKPASSSYSVRVGKFTHLDATGSANPGAIQLAVKTIKPGVCSNNMNANCTLDSQCVFGCGNIGTCQNADPSTDGLNNQFAPAHVAVADPGVIPCSTVCP